MRHGAATRVGLSSGTCTASTPGADGKLELSRLAHDLIQADITAS
jgi:hypothetical protein